MYNLTIIILCFEEHAVWSIEGCVFFVSVELTMMS